jgi:hypothetical protein
MDNVYLQLFALIALLGLAGAFGTIVWLHRLLPNDIANKYSPKVLLQCKYPYPSNWESLIEPVDVPVLRKYRRVFVSWYIAAAVIVAIEILIWQGI